MAAMGATSAVALAGCLNSESEPKQTSEPTTKTSDEGLDPAKPTDVDRIAADPTDLPDPVDWSSPRTHEIEVTTTERIAEIEPGVTFKYMTFDDQVPGPMIRVRRGDTVRLTLTNAAESAVVHNIDLHAVYGPGGGADDTMVDPGQSATIEFKAMYPGVHVYHCAVPDMDMHISAGMFGAILVEPEDGLPEVDRELYFGQNEIYTNGAAGEDGHHEFDYDGMTSEEPTYVALNGEAYAFTEGGYGPITVDKGERVRLFYANGGPNLTSSWHAIGNVWETYYPNGALASDPDHYVETAPVVPGSVATAVIDTPVPGPIKLVDHALSRVVRKGMLGVIQVEGEAEPEIFNPEP
ncbi:nitrite reductase [Halovivax asiaticus JCM 14624]|uniref:Copper-containing nitrite reductase n=2 Tax=Halovivax asiaticus TaxID=332953 RepID=M0BIL2_9EURY|nr:nitrite reductase [Halovivax asiaticus JCM 14624]